MTDHPVSMPNPLGDNHTCDCVMPTSFPKNCATELFNLVKGGVENVFLHRGEAMKHASCVGLWMSQYIEYIPWPHKQLFGSSGVSTYSEEEMINSLCTNSRALELANELESEMNDDNMDLDKAVMLLFDGVGGQPVSISDIGTLIKWIEFIRYIMDVIATFQK